MPYKTFLNIDCFNFFFQDGSNEEPNNYSNPPAFSGVDLSYISDSGPDLSEMEPNQIEDTRKALELIDAIYRVRSKLDGNRPEWVASETASTESKHIEALTFQGSSVTDGGSTNTQSEVTSVLKKRSDDGSKQARGTTEQNALVKPSLENSFQLFTPVSCFHLCSYNFKTCVFLLF